ncbi:MAG: hypothetical protein K6V36_14030 [Anaerolineae bacterium]|nr:hypothetical protein [Anaerolineae bacterium]
MDSGMISKIEKAKRYAEERERIRFQGLSVTFRGEHNTYNVSYHQGRWSCECGFFASRGLCSHTMALERVLRGMLVPDGEDLAELSTSGAEAMAR